MSCALRESPVTEGTRSSGDSAQKTVMDAPPQHDPLIVTEDDWALSLCNALFNTGERDAGDTFS